MFRRKREGRGGGGGECRPQWEQKKRVEI